MTNNGVLRVSLPSEEVQNVGQLAAEIAHDFNQVLVAILDAANYVMDTLPPTHPAQQLLRGVVEASEQAAEVTVKMLAYSNAAGNCGSGDETPAVEAGSRGKAMTPACH
jgi:hypothetical protein